MKIGKWLLTAALVASASVGAWALPDDIVPRGDVAYDFLGSLASGGHIKGIALSDFFRGDRLYTRREMAEFVADMLAVNDTATLPASLRSQVRALTIEFAPELKARGVAIPSIPAGDAAYSLLLKVRGGADPVSGDLIGRGSIVSAVGRDGYAAVSFGNYRDEWYPYRPVNHDYPAIESVFVRYNTRVMDITVGRQPLRWGPGFTGAMLVGDDAPSVPQIRFEKGFDLPGSLGRRIGKLYFTQFSGELYEDDVPGAVANATGTQRYIFGRRIETAGDRGAWKLSLAESFKSTRLPGAGWAFFLPFYAYQDAFTDRPGIGDSRPFGFIADGHTYPNTLWFNYLADAQVTYRAIPDRDLSLYTDFLIDDINAPKGLQGNTTPTPRKVGVLVGGYCPRLDKAGRFGLRLEYATIDPNTFSSESLPVAYNIGGASLGYPLGGNANVYFGRFDARLNTRMKVSAEASLRRRDNENDPGASGDRYSLYGSYNLSRSMFVGARVDHVTGDMRLANVTTHDSTRGELSFGVGF